MIKRVFIVTLLATMLVSSCSAQATAEPVTATVASTETQAPTATQAAVTDTPAVTETVTAQGTSPTITATAGTPQPANDPNCTNSAAFVADVTIPDNTNISAGAPFTKTWRIANTGTCIWGSGYTLTHYSEERLGFSVPVPLPITYPGQNADISVNLTAPNNTGPHRGNFVIKNPAGLIMSVNEDSRLWLVINVTNDLANATAAAPTAGAATAATAAGLVTATCAFTADAITVTEAINAINAYRLQKGFPPYVVNTQLSKAAQSHANDMACNSLTGHTGSNGSTIESRIRDSGYVFTVVGENVYGSNPPLAGQAVVNAWIADKTDLRNNLNLISDSFLDMGVGYSFFNGTGYFVVDFGTP